MSVLIYLEHENNSLKKSTLEAISYAYAMNGGKDIFGVCPGNTDSSLATVAGKHGLSKMYKATNVNSFNAESHSAMVSEAAAKCAAKTIVIPASFSGKGIAPRVAIKLKAGYVDSVVALPDTSNGFTVRTGAYSGKAFADVSLLSETKVLSVAANVFSAKENAVNCEVEEFSIADSALNNRVLIKESIKAEGKISLRSRISGFGRQRNERSRKLGHD